jgi:hypothetical protein
MDGNRARKQAPMTQIAAVALKRQLLLPALAICAFVPYIAAPAPAPAGFKLDGDPRA